MTPRSRPEIGAAVHVRLGVELLARVDEYAIRTSQNRAEAVRTLLTAALDEHHGQL